MAASDLIGRREVRSAGASLPIIDSPVALAAGEVTHARTDAVAWWFGAAEVEYDEWAGPPTVGTAGPSGLVGFATLVANRRERAEAEALARPQWRALGQVEVFVTSERMLVLVDGLWSSLWFVDGFRLFATASAQMLGAATDSERPFLFQAEAMPYVDAVLAQLVDAEPVEPLPVAQPSWSALPTSPPPTCGRRGVTVRGRGRWLAVGRRW